MRLSPLVLLALLPVFAACTPVPAPTDTGASASSVPPEVTVTLELSASEDAQATVHTKARLNVTGAVTKIVNLGEVPGPLKVVEEKNYQLYMRPSAIPLLVLSSWWAGAGDEFIVTRTENALSVGKRSGDESGACTAVEPVGEIPLSIDAKVVFAGLGDERIDQSSLTFCAEQAMKSDGLGQ